MKEKQRKGWKGIGRALVLATTGPEDALQTLSGPDVVAIQLAGSVAQLSRRQTLVPELLDLVVLDATGEDRDEVVELSRTLRSRYLASVLIVPRDAWGQRMFRSYLSVYSHAGTVRTHELWTAVSVAAQLTWTYAWLSLEVKPRRHIEERPRKAVVDMQSALLDKTGIHDIRKPSRTEPWSPPPGLLVELTRAFNDEV